MNDQTEDYASWHGGEILETCRRGGMRCGDGTGMRQEALLCLSLDGLKTSESAMEKWKGRRARPHPAAPPPDPS